MFMEKIEAMNKQPNKDGTVTVRIHGKPSLAHYGLPPAEPKSLKGIARAAPPSVTPITAFLPSVLGKTRPSFDFSGS